MLNIKPPKKPSQDFFGESLGKSLCLPTNEPTKKAPVSLIQIIARAQIIIQGFEMMLTQQVKRNRGIPI